LSEGGAVRPDAMAQNETMSDGVMSFIAVFLPFPVGEFRDLLGALENAAFLH
jgi:hypothetical protein